MENRFESNEILSLGEYISLLIEHRNKGAYIKLYEKFKIFELAMTYRWIEAQKYLIRLNLKDILTEKLEEDEHERPID